MIRVPLWTLLLLLGITTPLAAEEFDEFEPLSDPDSAWSFGWASAISGDTLVLGDNDSSAGSVWIFERRRGNPNKWRLAKRLSSPSPEDESYFGRDLALDRDTLVVSVGFSNSVLLFSRDQGGREKWGFVKKLEIFGDAAIDGDLLATSGDGDQVMIFQRDLGGPDNWGLLATVEADDIQRDWAYAVDLSGRVLVVGGVRVGCGSFGDVCSEGYRVFEQDAADPTIWRQTFRVPGGGFGDATGIEVFIDGPTLLSTDGIRERAGGKWTLVGPPAQSSRFFGRALRQQTVAGWSDLPEEKVVVLERSGGKVPVWRTLAELEPNETNCNDLTLGPRELVLACPHGDFGTVRVYPRAALFEHGFEGEDLSRWSRRKRNVRLTSPGLGGSRGALAVDLDGKRKKSFVRERLADGEPSVSLSFLLLPGGARLGDQPVDLVHLSGAGRRQLKLSLEEAGSVYQVGLWARGGDDEFEIVGSAHIAPNQKSRFGLEWRRANDPLAADGRARLLVNGNEIAELDDLDNHAATLSVLTVGLPAGAGGTEGGTVVFDRVALHR